MKTVPNNPLAPRHRWDQLWSLPGDLNRKFEHTLSSRQHARHTSLKTTETVTNKNMVIVPHPNLLAGLSPCDFTLFPKLKTKLKG
jgi:hypothetical protein